MALVVSAAAAVHAQAPGDEPPTWIRSTVTGPDAEVGEDAGPQILVTRDGRVFRGDITHPANGPVEARAADGTITRVPASEILYEGRDAPVMSDAEDSPPGARYEYIRYRPPVVCHDERTDGREPAPQAERCGWLPLRLYDLEGPRRLLCEGACELLLRRGTRHLGLAPPALPGVRYCDRHHQQCNVYNGGPPIAGAPLLLDHSGTLEAAYQYEDMGMVLGGYVAAACLALVGGLVLATGLTDSHPGTQATTGTVGAVLGLGALVVLGVTFGFDMAGDSVTMSQGPRPTSSE